MKFGDEEPVMRASAAPALLGFTAILCVLGSVSVLFKTSQSLPPVMWNTGVGTVAFIGFLALFYYARMVKGARVISGRKVRLFQIVSALVSMVVIAALIFTPVYESWLPLGIAAVLVGIVAIMSIFWFRRQS